MKIVFRAILGIATCFTLLRFFFDISFSHDLIDRIMVITCLSLGAIFTISIYPSESSKLMIAIVLAFLIGIGYLFSAFLGYSSETQKTWRIKDYKIELEFRLGFSGPGLYYLTVDQALIDGLMERRVEQRPCLDDCRNAGTASFVLGNDTVSIDCCRDIIESRTLQEIKEGRTTTASAQHKLWSIAG